MIDPREYICATIRALNELSIPHMLTGSLASNVYGRPRSTRDADFVIELGEQSPMRIAELVRPLLRLDPQLGFETVTATERWKLRASSGGFEVELFRLSNDDHDTARFARRRPIRYESLDTFIPTVEDVLVQKLRWAHLGNRSKDVEDALNVILVSGDSVDWEYVRRWCDKHGSRALLEELQARADAFNRGE
jgi:hypothetical protein